MPKSSLVKYAVATSWQDDPPGPRTKTWQAQIAKLVTYEAQHGDCAVPRRWAEDPVLGSWVNH